MKPSNYLILLILPALVILGRLLGGWYNFSVPLLCFLAHPAASFLLSSSEEYAHSDRNYSHSMYRNIALIFVPILMGVTFWCLLTLKSERIDMVDFIGLALSLGMINGIIGFTLAHEFIHSHIKSERIIGFTLLFQNNYMHYGIEHIRGHHVYACTPSDPHTARIGESVYTYLPRSLWQTYINAVAIEKKRLKKTDSRYPVLHNRIFIFALLQIGLMLTIFLYLSGVALLLFLSQNLVAILLLHIINYMQHYGLMREKSTEGKYEKINEHHAWNTARRNAVLNIFQLENHADHHMHPAKTYDQLIQMKESPAHPLGFSLMILLSLFPPLWFRIMNKRIPSKISNSKL